MENFKGTSKIVIDQESVYKPLLGYISVELRNTDGYPVATVFAPDFEKLKADSLVIAKAPEMLKILKLILEGKIRPREYQSEYLTVENLIKEATEFNH